MGAFLVMVTLAAIIFTPAYFIAKFAADSYTLRTDDSETLGLTPPKPLSGNSFLAEGNRLARGNGSPIPFFGRKWATAKRRVVLHGPHVNSKRATTPPHRTTRNPKKEYNPSLGGQYPVQLLCFFGATFDGPWPTGLCSHLAYSGSTLSMGNSWVQLDERPAAQRAFRDFLALKERDEGKYDGHSQLVLGVSDPPTKLGAKDTSDSWPLAFAEQVRARDLALRAAEWLGSRHLDGLALLGQRLDPARVDVYITILKEFRTAFSGKLLLLFSIYWNYDFEKKGKHLFLEPRIKELVRLADFTLLETHVPPHRESECNTFLPNSFSRSAQVANHSAFFMNPLLEWMDRAVDELGQSSVCFTMTLAVMRFLLPRGHSRFGEPCQDFYPASYMQNCRLWEDVRFDSSSAANYAEVPFQSGMSYHRLDTFDNIASLDVKLESILSQFPRLCLALVHVDLDDYLGACGNGHGPYARLSSAQDVLRRFVATAQFYVDLRRR
ncbi:uncharacterized protein LOC144179948 [Haemaphysalis longicornis]